MKKIGFIILLFISFNCNAQILNGSFEFSNAPPCSPLIDNSVFNTVQLYVNAFGNANHLGLYANFGLCGYGNAQDSDWFAAMSVDTSNTKNDAIAFSLASPLISGNTYVLNFYQRNLPGYTGNLIAVGISNSDTTFGTTVFTTSSLPSAAWAMESAVFTSSFNANYITIKTIVGSSGYNLIDNFQLTDVTAINSIRENISTSIYPNPADNFIEIKVTAVYKIHKCRLSNAFGKTIMQFAVSEGSNKFDVSDLSPGIYFLTDETTGTQFKIIIE